jgi:hypothetical protein
MFLLLFLPTLCYAEEDCQKDKDNAPHPPQIGNFAVPSQLPGSLFSFGQRTLGQGKTQLSLFVDYFAGKSKHSTDLIPNITYGMLEDLSVNFSVPLTPSTRSAFHTSSGVEDMFLQLEYVTYHESTTTYEDCSTLVGSVSFPSGSSKKNPPTGLGSSSFFIGATFFRTYTDWLWFLSDGIIFPTYQDGYKAGNDFLYQGAVGRNIFSIKDDISLAWLVEFNGFYTQKSKFNSKTDPDSGGNIIFITPSLQLCTEHLLLQVGVGFPITQHLNGHQKKNRYLLVNNFVWTF